MNANDNFEKKDLGSLNETPNAETTTPSSEQNKEAVEGIKNKVATEPADSEVAPQVEATDTAVEVNTETTETEVKAEAETSKDEHLNTEKPQTKETPEDETHKEPVDTDAISEEKKVATKMPLTFEEIVAKLEELAGKEKFSRKELEKAQGLFFSEIRKEAEAQKEKFLADGGNEEAFEIKESELHTKGKNLLQVLAEKRKKIAAEEEKEKETNYERKLAIIEEVKALTESQEDFNKKYQDFKELQQEWKKIKLVPHDKEHALWKSYQEQVEKFYDIVHIHNEYRDYDFKKNLESKIELCKAAEKLMVEDDLVSAFHQLQKLHKDWRDIGPVARKDRELIWERFKEASAEINRRYQTRIENLKEQENANYEKKVAICEKLESIDINTLKSPNEWESKTQEVLNLQQEWRKIGYAPRKVNTKIFKRYRAACDLFFDGKNKFYESIRGELEENLKKKIELCERAEAMKDSQDWKNTTADMIQIQREWKEIGMIPRKHSSRLWKRFIGACDYFFEQKKLHSKSIRQEEEDNLKLKTEITEKINSLDTTLPAEEVLGQLKALMDEWHAVGFVPFKKKDKAYEAFADATDAHFNRLNIDKAERRLSTFKSNISELSKSEDSRGQVFYERNKLVRQFEKIKSELQTYENNIGFLTAASKKGSSLLDDFNKKIEKTKAELELIEKKIKAIDENIEE